MPVKNARTQLLLLNGSADTEFAVHSDQRKLGLTSLLQFNLILQTGPGNTYPKVLRTHASFSNQASWEVMKGNVFSSYLQVIFIMYFNLHNEATHCAPPHYFTF